MQNISFGGHWPVSPACTWLLQMFEVSDFTDKLRLKSRSNCELAFENFISTAETSLLIMILFLHL